MTFFQTLVVVFLAGILWMLLVIGYRLAYIKVFLEVLVGQVHELRERRP